MHGSSKQQEDQQDWMIPNTSSTLSIVSLVIGLVNNSQVPHGLKTKLKSVANLSPSLHSLIISHVWESLSGHSLTKNHPPLIACRDTQMHIIVLKQTLREFNPVPVLFCMSTS